MIKRSWWRSYFWKKKTRSTRKNLNRKFIRINSSKENYDADYEIGRIQAFISKFKNKKLRELEKENEELKEKVIKDGEKKIRKINILLKQKMECTYCVSCKKYIGNSHFDSKTINNKVKLLQTKFCK